MQPPLQALANEAAPWISLTVQGYTPVSLVNQERHIKHMQEPERCAAELRLESEEDNG